jgi:hypothetical protein
MRHPTRDLPPDRWTDCLEEFARERRNAPTVLRIEQDGNGPQVAEHDLLLRDVSYDPRGDVVHVMVFNPDARLEETFEHVVDGPVRVSVDSPEGIVPTTLEIEDREGVRTMLRVPLLAEFSG